MTNLERDREAIARLHQRDESASRTQDFAALRSLMDDDAVVLPPGAAPLRGKQELDAGFTRKGSAPPETDVLEFRFEWEELEIIGDHAIEWGRIKGAVRNPATGERQDLAYNVLRVLRRQSDGEWKVYRTIWNDAPAARRD